MVYFTRQVQKGLSLARLKANIQKDVFKSDTRSDLLKAADTLLAELGLAGATSRKIAAEAGATVASVNYYFGSRDGLITEVVASHMVPVMQRMTDRIEAGDGVSEDAPVRSILFNFARTMLVECMSDPILREAMGVLFSNPALTRRWRQENIIPYLDRIVDVLAPHLPHLDYMTVRRRFGLFGDAVSGQIIRRMELGDSDNLLAGLNEFIDFMLPGFLA